MHTNQRESEYELHKRLQDGDITASAEIAEHFLFILIQRLRHRYPFLDDPHLVDSAVHDALVRYFQHPYRYDPTKSSLATYLLMSAEGDLRNSLSREMPFSLIEVDATNYDELERAMNLSGHNNDIEGDLLDELSIVWERLYHELPTLVDREIVQAMLDQEHKTTIYADILGIQSRPYEEQQTIVKQHKDRLRKKLRRALDPSEFRNNE